MSLFDYFADMKVPVTPVVITQIINANGEAETTETDGTAVQGVLYQASAASTYFNETWAENVSSVVVLDDITGITNKSKVKVDGVKYSVDYGPDDVGSNNLSGFDNVYVCGVNVIK